MIDPTILAFAGVAALITILPGIDMALVAKVTLQNGKRAAFFASVGINSGLPVHATASAFGLSVILSTSAEAFTIVKIAGALYLAYLGVQTFRHAGQPVADVPAERVYTERGAFVQGFLNNVLNPKVALFYLTFLPQFINAGDNVLLKSLFLASIHIAMGLIWLTTYAYAIERLAALMRSARRWLERVSGSVLIGLAMRLAFEPR